MSKKITVVAFNRSGSTFLCLRLISDLGLNFYNDIEKTHDEVNTGDTYSVSIIRNPAESIASAIAMTLTNVDVDSNLEKIDQRIKDTILEYESFYRYLLNKFTGDIFTFDALINVPTDVIKKIGNRLNIALTDSVGMAKFNKIGINKYDILLSDKRLGTIHQFIPSSTATPNYEIIKDILKNYDLSKAFGLYLQAKSIAHI